MKGLQRGHARASQAVNMVRVKKLNQNHQAFVLLFRESAQQGTLLAEIKWILATAEFCLGKWNTW